MFHSNSSPQRSTHCVHEWRARELAAVRLRPGWQTTGRGNPALATAPPAPERSLRRATPIADLPGWQHLRQQDCIARDSGRERKAG